MVLFWSMEYLLTFATHVVGLKTETLRVPLKLNIMYNNKKIFNVHHVGVECRAVIMQTLIFHQIVESESYINNFEKERILL